MITKEKNIHYFPGHMKKALREIAPYVKLVDLVVEVLILCHRNATCC